MLRLNENQIRLTAPEVQRLSRFMGEGVGKVRTIEELMQYVAWAKGMLPVIPGDEHEGVNRVHHIVIDQEIKRLLHDSGCLNAQVERLIELSKERVAREAAAKAPARVLRSVGGTGVVRSPEPKPTAGAGQTAQAVRYGNEPVAKLPDPWAVATVYTYLEQAKNPG